MLSLKSSVNLDGLKPQAVVGMVIVKTVYEFKKIECVITSCNDSKHGDKSLHYFGRAFDVRTKNIPSMALKIEIADLCKANLGPQFDVVLESVGLDNEHLHIEWDPKTLKVTT